MAGKGKSVWRRGHLPGSQLGGVQDSVFAFPLNKRLGVPLGLTPQQRCVALVHGCTLWFHLEGDENWIGEDQRASRSCHSPACQLWLPCYTGHQSHLPRLAGHGHGSGPVAHWTQCKCSCQHHLGSLGQSVRSRHCLSPIQGGCSHLQRQSGEIMGWARLTWITDKALDYSFLPPNKPPLLPTHRQSPNSKSPMIDLFPQFSRLTDF